MSGRSLGSLLAARSYGNSSPAAFSSAAYGHPAVIGRLQVVQQLGKQRCNAPRFCAVKHFWALCACADARL